MIQKTPFLKHALFCALTLGLLNVPMMSIAHADKTADEYVSERQANFKKTGQAMRQMRAHLGNNDLGAIADSAQMIANWATEMPSYFPEGTGPDKVKTSAKASIWQRFNDFSALANNNHQAALALFDAAKAGDASLTMAKMQELGRTCGACHSQFKD